MIAHNDTTIQHPTEEVRYILPCTWKCSCDWNKVYTGWLVEIKGKYYHAEGERKDNKPTPEWMTDPNKK